MFGRLIHRYEVPVDDQWHTVYGCDTLLHVDCRNPAVVEFWGWSCDENLSARQFRAFATGQPIPEDTIHRGTVIAPGGQLVWHLIEKG